ncbi:MAG: triose-phosphate isomerase [Chloroflexi bacterium]|nr:triose-phosphate isomerase [Chloroflexota bacterium]
MVRPKLVVANWKMHTTLPEARSIVERILPGVVDLRGAEVVLCPPAPWLTELAKLAQGSRLRLGAQNMHYEEHGGFTGEVSPTMLAGLCSYVIVGHYERRILLRETDWLITQKILSAFKHDMTPVLCLGETADQRVEGATMAVVAQQLEGAITNLTVDPRLVVAYEPAWTTIGMAPPMTENFLNNVCGFIRDELAELTSREIADQVRILCGGSMSARNIGSLAAQPELDGVLTGSASLRPDDFVAICEAVFGG